MSKNPPKYSSKYALKLNDLVFFTKHLSVLLHSGIPIKEAIDSLNEPGKNSKYNQMLHDILAQLDNGQTLAQALARHPKAFNSLYVNIVSVGEESGTLSKNLKFLSKQLTKSYQVHQKITSALVYPAIILTTLLLTSSLIFLYILPRITRVFALVQTQLPLSTKILLALTQNGPLITGVFIIPLIILLLLLQLPALKLFKDHLLVKIPLLGKIIIFGQLADYCRNLGLLLKSGVPVTKSVQIVQLTLTNTYFKNLTSQVDPKLQEGLPLSKIFTDISPTAFPAVMRKLVAVGEKTGNLDSLLLYLGSFYQRELDNYSKNLTTSLEPILLVTVGLMVGFVALALIAPIYSYTSAVSAGL